MKVAVIGLGKLGACVAAVIADAGHSVVGVDTDPLVTQSLIENAPHPEPGLNTLLTQTLEDTLTIRPSAATAIEQAEISLIVVPTNSLPDGSFDSTLVERAVKQVKDAALQDHICVVVSTVSPGTMKKLDKVVMGKFHLVYAPLLIALGSVINDLRCPDLTIIGTNSDYARQMIDALFRSFHHNPSGTFTPHLTLEEAEIVKLTINAYVVAKIAFANLVAAGCGKTPNADAARVLYAVGIDRRIGGKYFRPGATGGQGPCFARDTSAFNEWLSSLELSPWIPTAVSSTEARHAELVAEFFNDYDSIAILGSAYKPGTPIIDNSFALAVSSLLTQRQKLVSFYDPMAELSDYKRAEDAINHADSVLIATAWPEFEFVDLQGKPTLDMWGIVKDPEAFVWGRAWPI